MADLPSLIDLIEGIDVAVVPSPDAEGHGLTVTDPVTGITIITAAVTEHPLRLRSSLAHELAHHVFGDAVPASGSWAPRSTPEQRADAFARHLLLPLDALTERLGTSADEVTEQTLSDLVQWFAVSPQMAAIQLAQAGYISASRKQSWMNVYAPSLATRYGWTPLYMSWQAQSRATLPPQRLLRRATIGYSQGLVSLDALARIRHASPAVVEADLRDAGITISPPAVVIADLD